MDIVPAVYNSTMKETYLKAVENGNSSTFSRLSNLFVREPDIDTGLGSHYIVDLVTRSGNSGAQVVSIVCKNHDIPVFFEGRDILPIRDIVKRILENLPPRCAIILDIRDNELLTKVRNRIANTHCDLRYRRVVFCLMDKEMPSGSSADTIHIPGSIEDKLTMLLYHIPENIQKQAKSPDCFRPLAAMMVDYVLLHPQIWRHVCVNGTIEEFLSTAMYQIVRRVGTDPEIGEDYPSFERDWRSVMATKLKTALATPPDALCPGIHRVIPIGCSPLDAMKAVTVAVPQNIQNPYAITVRSSAVDDQCGTIAIAQPMQYTIVNIHCLVNPGLLVDVCRELRSGFKEVVREVHSLRNEQSETNIRLSKMTTKHEETNNRLSIIQNEMTALVTRLTQTSDRVGPIICAKNGCIRIVTKRFRSGKLHRQCSGCQETSHLSRNVRFNK